MIRSLLCLLVAFVGELHGGIGSGAWRKLPLPPDQGMVSSLAVGRGKVAVGTAAGGVFLFDTATWDPFPLRDPSSGKPGRIHSLAWSGGGLWLATESGIFRHDGVSARSERIRREAAPAPRTGVRVLLDNGGSLWSASSRSVACYRADGTGSQREWELPIRDEPTSLLKIGGRILVGTSGKGLFLLDSASGTWIRIGRSEGLSSDQVTGLEWVGAEVFVSTPEGLDVLDLSSQKARVVFPDLIASWMTQANGTLFVSGLDGLVAIEAGTRTRSVVAMPDGVRQEGALVHGGGWLVAACGSELFARSQRTIFGSDGFRPTPEGFALALPRAVPEGADIQAFLRLPEWPEAKMALAAEVLDGGASLLVKLPKDVRGLVQIDLVASVERRVVEVRSLEGVGDRSKPLLNLDPVRRVVRDSQVEIAGKANGVAPLRLVLSPGRVGFEPAPDGSFLRVVALSQGENRFELALEDGIGNRTSRDFSVRRDEIGPVVDDVPDDTVAGDFARIRVPFHDAGPVKAVASGNAQVRVAVFDSFVVMEARRLAVGANPIRLVLEDEAGNVSTKMVQVVRRQASNSLLATSWGSDWGNGPMGVYAGGFGSNGDSGRAVHVVHYRMLEGETLCSVAEHFYGGQSMAEVLIRWNGFADSSQWRRMPVGTPVDVPFWKDFDHGNPDLRSALETFPWDRIPLGPRSRR